jgi:hypothetical protein
MKLVTPITTLLVAVNCASAAFIQPNNNVGTRQIIEEEILLEIETVIDVARDDAAESYRGRRLTEEQGGNKCTSSTCKQCRDGALTTALAEVAGCGIAALAVEVVTAGAATILEVAGFTACEVAIVGTYNQALAECTGLN